MGFREWDAGREKRHLVHVIVSHAQKVHFSPAVTDSNARWEGRALARGRTYPGRLCGSCSHRIGIGSKEALAVEMDDVVGIFGNPDLGLP